MPPVMRTLPALALCASAALAQPAHVPWDVQFSGPVDPALPVVIRSLDLDDTPPALVADLTARGVFTICYVSVGTLESWRSDASRIPADLIGAAYDGWPGERFLDIRDHDRLRPVMRARFARCAAAGFQAIEADNIDLNWADTGFALSESDAVAWARAMAEDAHDLGLVIGQKNAPDLTAQLEDAFDFAITEDCLTDGWCADLAPYAQTGRAILAIEYRIPAAQRPQACAQAHALGLSVVFKARDLGPEHHDCRDY